eukprot:scaffold82385_cov27-Attheya_sp.AAC.1
MDSVNSFANLDLSAEAPTSGVTPRSGLHPPSPGTSPLFSTPSSAMSGSTGGRAVLLQGCGEVYNLESPYSKGGFGERHAVSTGSSRGTGKVRTGDWGGRSSCRRDGQLKDEFLGEQMESNLSSPGSWTP